MIRKRKKRGIILEWKERSNIASKTNTTWGDKLGVSGERRKTKKIPGFIQSNTQKNT